MSWADFLSRLHWRPQIGDPTFMGWLTVAAYAVAAAVSLMAALRQPASDREGRRSRRVWMGVAILMAALCVNKQLDLQSLLTDVGRVIAHAQGWYDQRRLVQRWFVAAVSAGGIIALAALAWRLRSVLKGRRLLLFGLGFLLMFIIIRAASFHHVDELLGVQVIGLRVNWILELTGIGLVGLSAALDIRKIRRSS